MGEIVVLVPDKLFLQITSITAELLARENVQGLVLDIDYTLADKHTPLPDSAVKEFVENMKQAQIRLFILSNNNHNRVSRFAKALDLPYRSNGLKPLPNAFSYAVDLMKLDKKEVVAVGDQVYTDVWGAHLAGLRAWMVAPYGGGGRSFFYRFRRLLEKPFIHSCKPEDEQVSK